MDNTVRSELLKCKVAKIGVFNDDTTKIIIKKPIHIPLQENNCYLIQLDEVMLNPNPNSSLVVNWNNNNIPKYKYLKIDVIQIMNQMVKVNGSAYDYENKQDINYCWCGWLLIDNIDVLERL